MTSSDPENGFVHWLQAKMDKKGWTAQELAKRAGVAQATVSNVMSRKRAAGVDFAKAVAAVLDVSQVEAFREAGLIDEATLDNEKDLQELRRVLAKIDNDAERQYVIDLLEAVVEKVVSRNKEAGATQSKLPGEPSHSKSKQRGDTPSSGADSTRLPL